MIIDCCAQQRTYEKFFGLMGQRFCQVPTRLLLISPHFPSFLPLILSLILSPSLPAR